MRITTCHGGGPLEIQRTIDGMAVAYQVLTPGYGALRAASLCELLAVGADFPAEGSVTKQASAQRRLCRSLHDLDLHARSLQIDDHTHSHDGDTLAAVRTVAFLVRAHSPASSIGSLTERGGWLRLWCPHSCRWRRNVSVTIDQGHVRPRIGSDRPVSRQQPGEK